MNFKILISFALPEQCVEKIQKVSPRLKVIREWNGTSLIKTIEDVEIVFAGKMTKKMMQAAKRLKWIHSTGAGVDRFLMIPEIAEGPVVLTNSKGVHPTPISEHVMAFMLTFTRKFKEFILAQHEGVWHRSDEISMDELEGKTIGIIGLGAIGKEIARKAKCFGMTVLATKKHMTEKPPFVDEILPHYNLKPLLQRSDFVVISVPLTPETKGMFGKEELETMKRTAYLINIARGKVIKQKELIKALKEKKIAGAGLDVFEIEPLQPDSELWKMENAIITPHMAGDTIHYWERATQIFCENLKRYLEQKPMINLVNKKAGY